MTCVRRWTCWEQAAVTCCLTPSAPTRSAAFHIPSCVCQAQPSVTKNFSAPGSVRPLCCSSGRKRPTPCRESTRPSKGTYRTSSPQSRCCRLRFESGRKSAFRRSNPVLFLFFNCSSIYGIHWRKSLIPKKKRRMKRPNRATQTGEFSSQSIKCFKTLL